MQIVPIIQIIQTKIPLYSQGIKSYALKNSINFVF